MVVSRSAVAKNDTTPMASKMRIAHLKGVESGLFWDKISNKPMAIAGRLRMSGLARLPHKTPNPTRPKPIVDTAVLAA